MNTVKVRDIEIGAGAPKIIVPIVGVTKNDIIEEAKTFHSIPVDVVEWRVDWFEGVFDFAQVEDVLKDLREALGNISLLMTFRTSKEGGEKAIEPAAYAELNIKAAQTGYVDLVDVEIFTGDDIVKKIIDGAHAAGVKVIASNHDFFKTPAKADSLHRPLDCIKSGIDTSTVLEHIPAASIFSSSRINRNDHTLAAKLVCSITDQPWCIDSRGIDTDLIGALT